MDTDSPKYDHELYKHCDEKDADAIAWAFTSSSRMEKFPFKFPPLGKNEIRVNVLFTGLCQSDVLSARGKWGKVNYPLAPGHEIIGEVAQLGSEVKDFKIGEKVGFGTRRHCCGKCNCCKEGLENQCEDKTERMTFGKYWGGYATQMQQPADHFFHLPDNFDIEKGAPLFCAGITTYSPMKKFLKPGMKAAVSGIGGLGHMAIKFLHSFGHHVTGITSSTDKKDLILSLGADEVICTQNKEEMEKAKSSFKFMINTLPTTNGYGNLVHLIAPGGFLVQVGEPPSDDKVVTTTFYEIVCKEITLCGSLVGTRSVIREMISICAEKNIYPMVETFSFEDFPKAFNRLENERPKFRCVVNVRDWAAKNGWKK